MKNWSGRKLGIVAVLSLSFAAAAGAVALLQAQEEPANAQSQPLQGFWRDTKTNGITEFWACSITDAAAARTGLPSCAQTACPVAADELGLDQNGNPKPDTKVCMRGHSVDITNAEALKEGSKQLEFGKLFKPDDLYRFCGFGPRLFTMIQLQQGKSPGELGKWKGFFRVSFDTIRGKPPKEGRLFHAEIEQIGNRLRFKGSVDGLSLLTTREKYFERVDNPPPACVPPPLTRPAGLPN